MRIIGIDPGLNGGIAYLEDEELVEYTKLPTIGEKKGRQLNKKALIRWVQDRKEVDRCVIEDVHSMPKQGVSSVFKFGMIKGQLDMLPTVLGIPLYYVTPQRWKKIMLEGTAKDKNAAILYVTNRFGISLNKSEDGIADAILIALAGEKI